MMGFRSLSEIIGRTDLIEQISRGSAHLDDLDLNPLLVRVDSEYPPYRADPARVEVPDTLDAQILRDAEAFFTRQEKMQLSYAVRNTQRAIGARSSSAIVRKWGMDGLPEGTLTVQLRGSAGQSLGAFLVKGMAIELIGEANDYVGKGLSGGTIAIRPLKQFENAAHENAIIGNTVLYGATSGKLFAAGQAGERFAVRNSGATAVVEGVGANGCEYMTGGMVAILGAVGDNFGAGMTGGMAFVYDPHKRLTPMINPETVIWRPVKSAHWQKTLRALLEEHAARTGSVRARLILDDWANALGDFWQICPKEMLSRLEYGIEEPAPVAAA
jgi:glutamate synthase (NADPH/NADH) large chain